MGIQIKNKLVFKDLGNPKTVDFEKLGTDKFLLGTIVGIATATVTKKAADGLSEFTGLKGNFEGIPADPTRDTIQSGVAFLGEAFQSPIEALLNGDENNDPVESVKMAFELYVTKAANPQGYSWALKPLTEATPNDPLAELRALMNKPAETPQVEDKSKK